MHGDAVGLGEIEEIEEEAVHHDEEQQEKKKALLPDSEHLDGAGVEGGSSLKWGANNASGHTSLASPGIRLIVCDMRFPVLTCRIMIPGQSALKLGANNASGRTPLASPGIRSGVCGLRCPGLTCRVMAPGQDASFSPGELRPDNVQH